MVALCFGGYLLTAGDRQGIRCQTHSIRSATLSYQVVVLCRLGVTTKILLSFFSRKKLLRFVIEMRPRYAKSAVSCDGISSVILRFP
jgi:hypothetical protein